MSDCSSETELKFSEPITGRAIRGAVNAIIVGLGWDFYVAQEELFPTSVYSRKGENLYNLSGSTFLKDSVAVIGRLSLSRSGSFIVAPANGAFLDALDDRQYYQVVIIRPYDWPGFPANDETNASATEHDIALFIERFRSINGAILL